MLVMTIMTIMIIMMIVSGVAMTDLVVDIHQSNICICIITVHYCQYMLMAMIINPSISCLYYNIMDHL